MNERIEKLADQCHHRYSDHSIDLEKFFELIGRDMLALANRHGNIKPHAINAYFGFENNHINSENIKDFVNEQTS